MTRDRSAWWPYLIGFAASFIAACWLASMALAPVLIPPPSGEGAVLVSQVSPRSQGSVWIETEQAIDPDPRKPVTVSFYASFETADVGQRPREMSAKQLLDTYEVTYVLAGRWALGVDHCDVAASRSNLLTYQDLDVDQRYMAVAMVAAARGERVSDRNRVNIEDVATAERTSYRVLSPLEAETSSWPKRVGDEEQDQATAVMQFHCIFKPEAFWDERDGVALFVIPGLHGSLQRSGGSTTAPQQRLQRGFTLASSSEDQWFEAGRSSSVPRRNADQSDAYVNTMSSPAQIDFAPETAAFFDSRAESVRNLFLLLVGVLAGLSASILWDGLKQLFKVRNDVSEAGEAEAEAR